MRHGSLFSGIGGFDLAAKWMGWENKFHCEWNEFGQKVLKHYWPNAISYNDITQSDFTIHRGRIDILTGGFPCQPYSLAGKRKGKEDERHLWPEMLRAIREIQPNWVVGENVFGLVNWSGGLVFHEVQADLEAEGYEVWPYVLPACAVNAPHRRDRVWFVAHAKRERLQQCEQQGQSRCKKGLFERICIDGPAPHATSRGRGRLRHCGEEEGACCSSQAQSSSGCGIPQLNANANNEGLEGREKTGNTRGGREELKEQPKRLFNRSEWRDFPTKSPVCNGDDGLSSRLDGITFSKWRTESVKAGGNAIVPQVAYQVFKAIEAYESGL